MKEYFFTSESVAKGHPDKTCDIISDTILDAFIEKDPFARVAIETFVTKDNLIIGGETASKIGAKMTHDEVDHIIRKKLMEIGHACDGFHYNNVKITNLIHGQSADIALGVDESDGKEEGAGDQGIMFGYACEETPHLMPAAIYYAHKILENIEIAKLEGLGPDAKSQVTASYENGIISGISAVVLSIQHHEAISLSEVKKMVMPILASTLPNMPSIENIYINPTGRFVIGGPVSDTGLTGRKIIVDTYGGSAPHGGGAFSGKDPTKVDRSAAYMARYLAKNIVSSKVASRVTIQLSYAIGVSKPLSIYVNCHGTAKVDERAIIEFFENNISLSPKSMRESLQLNRPIYQKTASFGHFGRNFDKQSGEFSWENIDLADKIAKYFA